MKPSIVKAGVIKSKQNESILSKLKRIITRYKNAPLGVFSCIGYKLIQEGTSQAHCQLHHSVHQYLVEIVPETEFCIEVDESY